MDIIQHSTTTHNETGTSVSGGITYPANPTYAYDLNTSTYFGTTKYKGGSGDWGYYLTLYSNHEFAMPVNLTSVVFKTLTQSSAAGSYPNGHQRQYVQIAYAAAPTTWVTLWSVSFGTNTGIKSYDTSVDGDWKKVSGVRVKFDVQAGGDRDGTCTGYLYDIRAIGTIPGGFTQII